MKICIFVSICASIVLYSIMAEPVGMGAGGAVGLGGSGNTAIVSEYTIFSTEAVASPLITNTTDLGYSWMYNCDARDAEEVKKLFTRIDGEQYRMDGGTVDGILKGLGAHVVSKSRVGDEEITYAYSAREAKFITEKGQKVNVQVARRGLVTVVGVPLILGGY